MSGSIALNPCLSPKNDFPPDIVSNSAPRAIVMDRPKELDELPHPWYVDVGCGGAPFPWANILVDKYRGDTEHRNTELLTDGKLFVEAAVDDLPFEDGEVDFITCSHVIEHLDSPITGINELQRVARKGCIWVPSVGAEAASRSIGQVSESHKWVAVRTMAPISGGVIFFMQAEGGDVDTVLQKLGLDTNVIQHSFGTELRVAWGWGHWPDRLSVQCAVVKASAGDYKPEGTIEERERCNRIV